MSNVVERFDLAIRGYGSAHLPPTEASLNRISTVLRIRLPDLLVTLAKESSRFGHVFLSLGEDYESPTHIISYNRYWRRRRRTRRLPSDLVIISNGFMDEDFDCLVRPDKDQDNEGLAVEYWSPAPIGHPKNGCRGPRYSSFEEYLEGLVRPALA